MTRRVSLMSTAIILVMVLIFTLLSLPALAADNDSTLPAVEWQTIYGGKGSDVGYSAAPTADGYLVLGTTKSYGNGSYDAWLLKLDNAGHVLWNRTYGGTGGDWCYGIMPTADGNYVMAGATSSTGNGGFDIWVVKVNGNGDLLWSKTYGGPNNDAGFAVAVTDDGGYAITGYGAFRPGIVTSLSYARMRMAMRCGTEHTRTGYRTGVRLSSRLPTAA